MSATPMFVLRHNYDMTDDGIRRREALKAVIESTGLKLAPFAEKAGVSRTSIISFFDGKTRSLSADAYEKIMATFGVTFEELVGLAPRRQKWSTEQQAKLDQIGETIFGHHEELNHLMEVPQRPVAAPPSR